MTHDLQWDFNYTYSSSIGIGSNAERVNEVDAYDQADPIINSWSPAQLRGVSNFDTTHQFNTNWICQLPFGRGHRLAGASGHLLNAVVGGPLLVEYLGLTPTQTKAIQKLMDRERPTTEPLMDELRTISAELGVAIQQSQNNENEGTAQRLAARQARLLKQLMSANSPLQRRINDALDPRQRKKLDSFNSARAKSRW